MLILLCAISSISAWNILLQNEKLGGNALLMWPSMPSLRRPIFGNLMSINEAINEVVKNEIPSKTVHLKFTVSKALRRIYRMFSTKTDLS
jgi:hypothetical protein